MRGQHNFAFILLLCDYTVEWQDELQSGKDLEGCGWPAIKDYPGNCLEEMRAANSLS